jgi:hypothetical protein
MKLHKTWAAVLFLCVCVTMASAQTKKLRVVADSANIYIEPHKGSTVIGRLRYRGGEIMVLCFLLFGREMGHHHRFCRGLHGRGRRCSGEASGRGASDS